MSDAEYEKELEENIKYHFLRGCESFEDIINKLHGADPNLVNQLYKIISKEYSGSSKKTKNHTVFYTIGNKVERHYYFLEKMGTFKFPYLFSLMLTYSER